MGRDVDIIVGPPGTGKTTRLLKMLEAYLTNGGSSERVGFVSFSRRAIGEVIGKLGRKPEDFPHFRTIHSTAYHFLELHRDDVIQFKHWKAFSQIIGLPFSAAGYDDPIWDGTIGDRSLGLYNLARARDTSVEHEWREAMLPNVPLLTVKDIIAQYEKFKTMNGIWDFHDMIVRAQGDLPVDVLFVDEAQDTSRAQWQFLRRAAKDVPYVIMAGDDDQAVYAWSGADASALGRFDGRLTVLEQSYRLPRAVKTIADDIAHRIPGRVPKTFAPRVDPVTGHTVEGEVTWRRNMTTIDLRGTESWLLLARSKYQLESYRSMSRSQGVIYTLEDGTWSWSLPAVQAALTYERLRRGKETPRADVRSMLQFAARTIIKLPPLVSWEQCFDDGMKNVPWMQALPRISASDREYIRALLQSKESLTKRGRVQIGTVHSSKGAEADNVVLQTDISERVVQGARRDPNSEHRVQYVGVTRAMNHLHLILPETATYWRF